ncbi:MAG: PilZ domain-containing protein [Nitrospirae bacterium]|nr:PilZ domain-containing protein [Nitrospirota bacterium]
MKYVHDEGVIQEERSVVADGIVPVRWPVSYAFLGSRHFLSKGTILDVTASGFRVTGTMPVEVGMRLRLWGGPPAKPEPFDIRATVVWVKGHEFGLDLHSLGVDDQQWLSGFLAEAHSQLLLPQAA